MPVSGQWNTASNWNENRVPDNTDTACIQRAGDYTVELVGARTVQGLIVGNGTVLTSPGPTLEVSDQSGHLTILSSGEIRGSGRLFIDLQTSSPGAFGIVDGPGDVTVIGHLEWEGEIRGTGTFVAQGTTTLAFGLPDLRTRTFVNTGTVTVAENVGLDLFDDATFENQGLMIWDDSGTSERGIQGPGGGTPGTFVNVGTLRQQGENRLAFDVPVVNSGTVEVTSGQVQFRKDTSHMGASFIVADGARLEFSNQNVPTVFPLHTVDATTTAGIDGTLAVTKAATLDVAADWAIAGTVELETNDGPATLTGSGALTTAGLVWGNQTTISGTGDFTVTGDNPATTSDQRGGILDGRTLSVEGTLTTSATVTLQNGGRLEASPNGEVTLLRNVSSDTGGGILSSEGTLHVASRIFVEVPIEVSGTLALLDGIQFLIARGGMSCAGGTIQVDAGEELRLEGGTGHFDGCEIEGGGKVTAWNDAVFVVDGAGATVGGTATLEASSTGVLMGTGPVTLTGGTLASGGSFRPGTSLGIFSVVGNLTQSRGEVQIEVGGLVPGTGHDQIGVTGTFTADGDLVVSFVDGFFPTAGDRFVIATCGACTGAFDRIDAPDGVTLEVESSATELTLVVSAAVAGEALPSRLDVLSEPAPNPASGVARIELTVSSPEAVALTLHDALGREVLRLHNGPLVSDIVHAFTLDTASLTPGLYFLRALGPTLATTRPLTVVR